MCTIVNYCHKMYTFCDNCMIIWIRVFPDVTAVVPIATSATTPVAVTMSDHSENSGSVISECVVFPCLPLSFKNNVYVPPQEGHIPWFSVITFL